MELSIVYAGRVPVSVGKNCSNNGCTNEAFVDSIITREFEIEECGFQDEEDNLGMTFNLKQEKQIEFDAIDIVFKNYEEPLDLLENLSSAVWTAIQEGDIFSNLNDDEFEKVFKELEQQFNDILGSLAIIKKRIDQTKNLKTNGGV